MLARGSFTAMTMKLLFMKLLFISLVARHAAAYRVAECGGVTRRGLFAGAAAVSGTAVATAALPALAGKDADAEAVLSAKQALGALLADEQAFRDRILVNGAEGGSGLPTAISFVVFQRLEKRAKPGDFMDSAIEYAEHSRNARDLVRLAVLGRQGANGGPDVVKGYLDRAIPELKDAASELDALVKLLP